MSCKCYTDVPWTPTVNHAWTRTERKVATELFDRMLDQWRVGRVANADLADLADNLRPCPIGGLHNG